MGKKDKQHFEWNELRKAINDFLAEQNMNEDKQLGPYFIQRDIVVPETGTEINHGFCGTKESGIVGFIQSDISQSDGCIH